MPLSFAPTSRLSCFNPFLCSLFLSADRGWERISRLRCPCPPGQPNRGRGRSRPRTRLRPRSARLLACSPVRSFARSLTRFSLLASRFALPASRFPLRASRLAKKSDHPLACTTCPTSLTCLLRNARVGEPLHPMDPSRLDSPCDRRRASFLTANSAKDEAACSGRSERAGRNKLRWKCSSPPQLDFPLQTDACVSDFHERNSRVLQAARRSQSNA